MDNQDFDIKKFEELVEQIKNENPKIDSEFCKYIAGSYLLYDVMKINKPTEDLEEFKKANEMINKLTLTSVEIEA